MIDEGRIGEVVSLQLNENVGVMHMSHSYVRGNWRKEQESSPMLLAKSCHDLDVISYVLEKKCERINSYGSLMYFREENAPEGAPERCLDGCPAVQNCPFHAGNFYLGKGKKWARKFSEDDSREGIIKALHETSYGKCVFQSDNDVVDHQVVNMEFEKGTTASFSMSGFTRDQTRAVQIMGTKGEIRGTMKENSLSIYDFLTMQETIVKLDKPVGGHGGGDRGIMRAFLRDLDTLGEKESLSSAAISVRSHLMVFAAEESRKHKGKSVEIDQYYKQFEEG